MMKEIDIRKWFQETQQINRNVEETASYLNQSGQALGQRYMESRLIEAVLFKILEEDKPKIEERP